MKSLFFVSLLLVSCGSKTAPYEIKEGQITEGPDQIIVGRIASVSKRGKFVLIQKLGPGTLPKGIIYQSRGPDGRSASLRPSGERVRDFFAADLLSGETEKGFAVIAYQNLCRELTAEEETIKTKDEVEGDAKENLDESDRDEDGQDPQTIRDLS
ncbi:MAG: hypothetical protein ACPIG7_07955 [Akkermansiaceae bacterium]